MKILVTGAKGFIGKNLAIRLNELGFDVLEYTREHDLDYLRQLLSECDWIIHLAGINRPKESIEFYKGNSGFTETICKLLVELELRTPVIFSSSIQANLDNDYGKSKTKAEDALQELAESNGNPVYNFRLPNVFGKWCKPNYNSFVATFCNNIAKGEPITINDPDAKVSLVYVDDVIEKFCELLETESVLPGYQNLEITPLYQTTVGEVASLLRKFKSSRESLITEEVGVGLCRALYSTYLSYFDPQQFHYSVPVYGDERGAFSELVKTKSSGQFSFFSAKPGVTRGGHYHHTKNEKFVVVKGKAKFGFRHIVTNEKYYLDVSSEEIVVVETIPGWSHNITNTGDDELIVMLWANEIFDREKPDTITSNV